MTICAGRYEAPSSAAPGNGTHPSHCLPSSSSLVTADPSSKSSRSDGPVTGVSLPLRIAVRAPPTPPPPRAQRHGARRPQPRGGRADSQPPPAPTTCAVFRAWPGALRPASTTSAASLPRTRPCCVMAVRILLGKDDEAWTKSPRVWTKTLSNRETGSPTRRAIFVLKFQLENHLYFLIKSSLPDLQAGCATMSAN